MAKSEPTVSKMEAVRQTLAAGIDKPREAVAHIKEKFGLDVPAAVFSSYKSAINARKGSTAGKRGRKPAERNGSANGSSEMVLTMVRDVKRLVDAYGAEAVKGMADALAG